MIKKYIIISFLLVLSIGCVNRKINQDDDIKRFYLDDNYYNKSEFIKINSNNFSEYQNGSYILYIYNNYCTLSIPCEDIFNKFMQKYNISFLSMPFKEYRNISLYNEVKYAPSIIIVENGKIVDFLDAEKDDDLDKYQDVKEFEEWINKYVYFTRSK